MVEIQENNGTQNKLLRYTKRRDKILIVAVLIYMTGPTIYEWKESLDDIQLNLHEGFDFGDQYRGQEKMLYQIREEISDLRGEIQKQGRRTLTWRDVF